MTLILACSEPTVILTGSEGVPDEIFKGIRPVLADRGTVGNLTEAYIQNTEALTIVNGRLDVLCRANKITNCGPQ